MNKYIGKSTRTKQWVCANNLIVDPKNGDTYIVPELFNMEMLNLGKKSLSKYKVESNSVGVAIGLDNGGQTIYSGDIVAVSYYNRKPMSNKRQTVNATILFNEDAKIYYMKSSDNQVFLFDGDSMHLISHISRIGRQ